MKKTVAESIRERVSKLREKPENFESLFSENVFKKLKEAYIKFGEAMDEAEFTNSLSIQSKEELDESMKISRVSERTRRGVELLMGKDRNPYSIIQFILFKRLITRISSDFEAICKLNEEKMFEAFYNEIKGEDETFSIDSFKAIADLELMKEFLSASNDYMKFKEELK